jgi:hypothetical protein
VTSVPPDDPADIERSDHHKHMDYVQAVITRLANNSVLLKGWALTLSSAVLGFAITQKHAGLALAALVPVTAFWLLDTYYLRQERAFRDLYAAVAAKQVRDFKIEPKQYVANHSWPSVGFSVSLAVYYGAIAALTLVLAAILAIITAVSARDTGPESQLNNPLKLPSSSSTLSPSSPTPAPTATPPRHDPEPPSPAPVAPPTRAESTARQQPAPTHQQ